LIIKSKIETVKLLKTGKVHLVEIREKFPGDVYVFSLEEVEKGEVENEGKWIAFRNGEIVGAVELRNVLYAVINCKNDATISVNYITNEWVDPFIAVANKAFMEQRPLLLQIQLTDGPEIVTTYEMPIRKTNIFKIIANSKKLDTIEYLDNVYLLIAHNRLKIKNKFVFRLTFNKI
jgi:hypothetical protein